MLNPDHSLQFRHLSLSQKTGKLIRRGAAVDDPRGHTALPGNGIYDDQPVIHQPQAAELL